MNQLELAQEAIGMARQKKVNNQIKNKIKIEKIDKKNYINFFTKLYYYYFMLILPFVLLFVLLVANLAVSYSLPGPLKENLQFYLLLVIQNQ